MRTKLFLRLVLVLVVVGLAGIAPLAEGPGPTAPPAPAWVSASDGTFADYVYVSWPASAGATWYKVGRSYQPTETPVDIAIVTSGTSYSDVWDRCTILYYWVKACEGATCSAWSAYDTGWRAVRPPTGVSATDNLTDKVRVTWNASSAATYYEVYRGTPAWHAWWSSLTIRTYDDFAASPGVEYLYGVKACCGLGCSSVGYTDTGVRAMTPPTVSASDGTYTDKVRVTWTASTNATRYIVHRGTTTTPSTSWEVSGATTYDDTSAETGLAYFYWVQACRYSICSEMSNFNNGYRPIAAPTNVQASDGTIWDRVRITWTASPNAYAYRVYRNTTNNSASAAFLGTAYTTTYDDGTAVPDTRYYYWVMAYNGLGDSPFSDPNQGYRPVPAPTGVQASDGTFTDKVRVSWNAASGALLYKVYRNTVNNASTAVHLGSTGITSFDDATAAPGTVYYYWVRGYGTTGDGVLSSADTGYRQAASTSTPTATRTATRTNTPTATLTPRPTNTPGATPTRVPGVQRRVFLPFVMK